MWSIKRKKCLAVLLFGLALSYQNAKGMDSNVPEEKINPKVDYLEKYNELTKPQNFDPNQNAWPLLEKAFAVLTLAPGELKNINKLWPKDMDEDTLRLAKKWIDDNEEAIEYLTNAARKPYLWQQRTSEDNSLMAMQLPELKQYKTAAKLLCFKAKLLAQEGDFKEAFKTLDYANNIGCFLTGPGPMIQQMVGIADRVMVVKAAVEILHETEPDVKTVRKFQKLMERSAKEHTFKINFTAEKLMSLDFIQRNFTDDGEGGGYMPKERALAFQIDIGSEKIDRAEIVELYDKEFEYLARVTPKTPAQLNKEGIGIDADIKEMRSGNAFSRTIQTSYGMTHNLFCRSQAETDALIVIIALQRYEANTSQYPESLDELLKGKYLKQIPIDPFSDKPFVYKRTENNFILYSFAYDYDDDNGTHDPKWALDDGDGDFVFWPVQKD